MLKIYSCFIIKKTRGTCYKQSETHKPDKITFKFAAVRLTVRMCLHFFLLQTTCLGLTVKIDYMRNQASISPQNTMSSMEMFSNKSYLDGHQDTDFKNT